MAGTPLFPDSGEVYKPSATELHIRTGHVKLTGKLKNKYIDVALEVRPGLDTIKGGSYIRNVWSGRTADQELTEAWEKAVGIEHPAVPASAAA